VRACRTDSNQVEIVQALRKAGCTVTPTHMVGDGFPDLVVGRNGVNHLLEIKDGAKPPSARALTKDEKKFHIEWRGVVEIVYSIDDALRVVLGKGVAE
jgi:Holliday junction resolvase